MVYYIYNALFMLDPFILNVGNTQQIITMNCHHLPCLFPAFYLQNQDAHHM